MWWQWLIFAIIAVVIPVGVVSFKQYMVKHNNFTQKQINYADTKMMLYCLFYWLCNLFYMSFIIDNLTCKFIFGSLIMLIIFYNLFIAFISGKAVFKFGLIQDFLIGIALTIYLIYIIPNSDLQSIMIPVVSAVYGGLLTLVGVAWTIKKSDNDKKQEEIKKAKPIFDFSPIFDQPVVVSGSKNCFPEDEEKGYVFDVSFLIDNSDLSTFKLKRIMHDDKWFALTTNTTVLPNRKIMLSFKINEPMNIFLEVEDALENLYYYKIELVNIGSLNVQMIKRHTARAIKEVSYEEIINNLKQSENK